MVTKNVRGRASWLLKGVREGHPPMIRSAGTIFRTCCVPPCDTECGGYIPQHVVCPPVILGAGAGPVGLGRELPLIHRGAPSMRRWMSNGGFRFA